MKSVTPFSYFAKIKCFSYVYRTSAVGIQECYNSFHSGLLSHVRNVRHVDYDSPMLSRGAQILKVTGSSQGCCVIDYLIRSSVGYLGNTPEMMTMRMCKGRVGVVEHVTVRVQAGASQRKVPLTHMCVGWAGAGVGGGGGSGGWQT